MRLATSVPSTVEIEISLLPTFTGVDSFDFVIVSFDDGPIASGFRELRIAPSLNVESAAPVAVPSPRSPFSSSTPSSSTWPPALTTTPDHRAQVIFACEAAAFARRVPATKTVPPSAHVILAPAAISTFASAAIVTVPVRTSPSFHRSAPWISPLRASAAAPGTDPPSLGEEEQAPSATAATRRTRRSMRIAKQSRGHRTARPRDPHLRARRAGAYIAAEPSALQPWAKSSPSRTAGERLTRLSRRKLMAETWQTWGSP